MQIVDRCSRVCAPPLCVCHCSEHQQAHTKMTSECHTLMCHTCSLYSDACPEAMYICMLLDLLPIPLLPRTELSTLGAVRLCTVSTHALCHCFRMSTVTIMPLCFCYIAKSTPQVMFWVQAIPEPATGTACGAPEPAVQLLCLHPDCRDTCCQGRRPLL